MLPRNSLASSRPGSRGEMALIELAVRRRWPMTHGQRAMVMSEMIGIVSNAALKIRDRVAAARVILAADGINTVRERAAIPSGPNVMVNQVNVWQGALQGASAADLEALERVARLVSGGAQPQLPVSDTSQTDDTSGVSQTDVDSVSQPPSDTSQSDTSPSSPVD